MESFLIFLTSTFLIQLSTRATTLDLISLKCLQISIVVARIDSPLSFGEGEGGEVLTSSSSRYTLSLQSLLQKMN